METIFIHGSKHPEFADAYHIRKNVFTDEQGFAPEIEIDEYDDKAVHIIIYDQEKAIATARAIDKNNTLKVGRVAVLKSYRGLGIGKKIMNDLIEYAKKKNYSEISLSSQEHAIGFYEQLGFIKKGEIYLEENSPHILMTIRFD